MIAMKELKNSLKALFTTLVMLSVSMSALADGNNVVVQIGDIFYRLYQQQEMTGGGYWDAENNWIPEVYEDKYYATVTYNPEIDPWSSNSDGKYQGDLVIPETVNYNGHDYMVTGCEYTAYTYAHNLTSISFPKTINYIEGSYLGNLNNLETITVDSENPNYTTIDGVLYNKEVTNVLAFPRKRGGTYRVPATITEFGQNNQSIGRPILDELIIPATVTKIGNGIFQSYPFPQIKKVTIEDSENDLTIGSSNSGRTINVDGNDIILNPLFAECQIQEVYWGRNLKGSNPPFAYNSSLTKVTFGPKVTSVPKYSFYNCYVNTVDLLGGLEQWMGFDFTKNYTSPLWSNSNGTVLFNGSTLYGNVDIPASITSIPSHAFQYGCAAVTSINIHANVSDIADGAFRGLKILQNIYLDANNPYFILDENVLYNKEVTKIYLYPQLKPGDYIVPATVTELGDYLFSGCSKLTSITIPASVMKLGTCLFDGCTALKAVTIEDSNDELVNNAALDGTAVETMYIGRNISLRFYYDTYEWSSGSHSLRYLTISNKVTAFPYGFFSGCKILQSVNFNGNISEWCNISFANETATPFGSPNASPILYLNGNPLHSQVNIPSGATKIGAYAFYGQKGVSRINVPSTVTTIEQYAFNSPYISDVIIAGNSVITLESTSAFNDNTCIYVPKNLLAAYRAAPKWSDLADRIFPDGFLQVTVDLIAMSNSPALLPALNALEEVDGEYRITALTNLKIKGTMNGYDILMIRTKMPNLRKLDLSEVTIVNNDNNYEYYTGYHTDLETITPYMFYNIKNLKEVILPANIKTIQSYAFAKSGITSMVIPSTIKTIGSYAFYNCEDLVNLTLTKGLETIEWNAFCECRKLRALVLPTSLKRIESNAFEYCSGLTTIDFAEGLQYIGSYAFEGCYNLKELRMPTSLRQIDYGAFRSCSGLKEVHVPSMITQIGDYAFKDCGLKSVYAYTLTPVQINQDTFDYMDVELFAPKTSFYTYYINTQWAQFPVLKEFDARYLKWYTPRDYDIEINTTNPIPNADDNNRAEGNMEPGSGLIFIGDGQQLVKDLILNWQHGSNYPALIEDGNLDVEELKFIMNVYPGRWYFFSFPFDIKISNTTFDGKYVWRYYDAETRAKNGSGWKNVTDGWLRANVGYIFQANKGGELELPIDNPVFTQSNGQKEVNLVSHEAANPQDASWNFVGNPNLSYYSLDEMAEDFDSPITVWNDENQTYEAVVPGDDDYTLHPFQAFFVQKPADSDEVTFRADKRETYNQSVANAPDRIRKRAAKPVDENHLIVNVEISDGKTTDKTRVVFDDRKSMDYEAGTDASKFMSMAEVPQVYTLDNKNVKYAINTRPIGNNEVRLGFTAPVEGTYTISASHMDMCMALKDKATGIIHDFSNGAYTFLAEAGTNESRFTLVPSTSITNISENGIEGLDITSENGGISVNGINGQTVSIYNVKGIRVASLIASGSVNLPAGTYIVSTGNKTSKILVK